MEYTLKELNPQEVTKDMILAYYTFFEKLNGKSLTSSAIKKLISREIDIPHALETIDLNYGDALRALKLRKNNIKTSLIGVYDGDGVVRAILRMRNVISNNTQYACISELLPLNDGDLDIFEDVIKTIEAKLKGFESADVVTFEIPRDDFEFGQLLSVLGYNLVEENDDELRTLLYDKSLTRGVSLD